MTIDEFSPGDLAIVMLAVERVCIVLKLTAGAGSSMATFKDVVEVKDRPWNRAVKVTITAPAVSRFKLNSPQVIALAEKAWKSSGQTFTEGNLTVKVEAFGR